MRKQKILELALSMPRLVFLAIHIADRKRSHFAIHVHTTNLIVFGGSPQQSLRTGIWNKSPPNVREMTNLRAQRADQWLDSNNATNSELRGEIEEGSLHNPM
jgi:hypothetical protein